MAVKLVICVILFKIFSCALSEQKQLQQVVVLSRHNLRTPLSDELKFVSPKPWPVWKERKGYLTEKGFILEGLMGRFFSEWLRRENLLPPGCPSKEDIYIYANVKQRTVMSAKAFVNKAFPGCNITVHHNDSDKMDPIFKPVIHNTTDIFMRSAYKEMQVLLKSLNLNRTYNDMSRILDYKNSEFCMKEKRCNLNTDVNKIINVETGFKPAIKGPIKICSSSIDAFVMEYYEGYETAWGYLNNATEWDIVMDASKGYHNVIFNTPLIAEDIAKPLINYMKDIIFNNTYTPKMLLLMGHDANLYTVLKSMGFKKYYLQKQYEVTPIGGKIVFQRWFDEILQRDYLKIEYVYASSTQLRNAQVLSLDKPPQFTVLELSGCETDENGFCPWEDFVRLLKNL